METLNETYTLLGVLGSGGMSTVYLAEHTRLHIRVAIKRIPRDPQREPYIDNEYRLLKKLRHPLLPYVLDAFQQEDCEYIVEEYIPGKTLQQLLQDQGRIPEETARFWMKALCDVLDYLHSRTPPVIYRDLKPSNIMVLPGGTLKLLDFGIARETNEGTAASSTHVGSYGYAAPEQFGHGPVDARSDLYSLGVTFHHLLTGKSPYDPPYKVQSARELNPEISVGMDAVLRRCTQADPARRYKSVRSLRYDLDHLYLFEDRYKHYRRQILARRAWVTVLLTGAVALMGTGGWLIARETLDRAMTPQADAYRIGLQLMEENRYQEAIQVLSDGLETAEEARKAVLSQARGDAYYRAARQQTEAEPALELLELAIRDYEDAGDDTRADAARQLQQDLQAEQKSREILAGVYAWFAAGDSERVFEFMGQEDFFTCRDGLREESMIYTDPAGDGTMSVIIYRDDPMIYYGGVSDGIRQGEGILLSSVSAQSNYLDYLYSGSWEGDKPNGPGSVSVRNPYTGAGQYLSALYYEGNFVDGKLDGEFRYVVAWMDKSSEEAQGTLNLATASGMKAKEGVLQPLDASQIPDWYDPETSAEDGILVGYDEEHRQMYNIVKGQENNVYGALPFAGVLTLLQFT